MKINIRPAIDEDAPELCALLNEIIEIGSTTAFENPLRPEEFKAYFLSGTQFISCHVAVGEDGSLLGFQALECNPKLPDGWADIATFARSVPKVPGVGKALFTKTHAHAKASSIAAINATIRADNTSGLAYYEKIGFTTYKTDVAVPLSDGTPVDRISKKFDLAQPT